MTDMSQSSVEAPLAQAATLAELIVDDPRSVNALHRAEARRVLPFAICAVLLVGFWAVILMVVGVKMALSEQGERMAILMGVGLGAFLMCLLWFQSKALGQVVAEALKPLDARLEGVEGVTRGPGELRLTEDALVQDRALYSEAVHLAAFQGLRRRGKRLLMSATLPYTKTFDVADPRQWLGAMRARRAAAGSGWDLPGLGFERFHLSREAFCAQAARDGHKGYSIRGLLITAIAAGGTLGILLAQWKPWEVYVDPQFDALRLAGLSAVLALVFAVPGVVLLTALRLLWRGVRHGSFDNAVRGLTWGDCAWRLLPGALEVRRPLMRARIVLGAVACVEQRDGLLVLRAGSSTLAILPDTDDLRRALRDDGLAPRGGPWEQAGGRADWRREAA